MSDHASAEITHLLRRLELVTDIAENLILAVRNLEHSITTAIEVDGVDSDILHQGLKLARTITGLYDKYSNEVHND